MKSSIYFANNSITYVSGRFDSKKKEVKKFATKEINKGIFSNGSILDFIAAQSCLMDFIKKNDIQKSEIIFVIDGIRVLFKEIVVPKEKGKRQQYIIRNEVVGNIGEIDEYVVDYIITEQNKENVKALAYASSSSLIKDYISLAQSCEIQCVGIDISQNSMSKLVSLITSKGECVICISVNDSNVTINIIEDGKSILYRGISLNFKEFLDIGALNVGVEELADNFNKMLQFLKGRDNNSNVSKVIITGNVDFLGQVRDLFMMFTQIPCELLAVDNKINGGDEFDINKYANPIGALVRRSRK